MKNKLYLLLLLVIFTSCSSDEDKLEKNVQNLESIIEEYKNDEARKNEYIKHYNDRVILLNKTQDSIHERELIIDSLKLAIRKKNRATGKDNKELNKMLSEINTFLQQNEEIAEELNYIEFKSKSQSEITVALLNSISDKKIQINRLLNEIEVLKKDVASLKIENSTIKSVNQIITAENEGMKSDLKKFVISDFDMIPPLNAFNKPQKAKRIKKLTFKVNIGSSKYKEHKNEIIYIEVVSAKDGKVLNNSQESFFWFNDKKIPYTSKFEFEYKGKAKVLESTWIKPENFELLPGTYSAYFYSNGKQIGKKSFTLDK